MGRMKPQLLLRVPGCVKDTAFEPALSDPSVVPSFKWVGHNGYQGLLQPCFSPRFTLVPFISVFLFDHGQHTQPRSASASFYLPPGASTLCLETLYKLRHISNNVNSVLYQ